MKNWIRIWSTVLVLAGLTGSAEAGLMDLFNKNNDCKSCDCAADCAPECCKPIITKPCCRTVHTYQRRCSDIKPPCCDSCDGPNACCAPTANCCTNGACVKGCAPDACCAPTANCCNNGACDKGCAPDACCAPKGCCDKNACCDTNGCCDSKCTDCGAPADCCDKNACCDTNCCDGCDGRCCDVDPCKLAELIYKSQTACYAKQRARALRRLGNRYDCVCSPSIMVAFVYALNDADERVRATAADEIGDQLRKNECCCSPEITTALTCALGDCDRKVRRYATRALRICGYKVVKGDCDSCDGCDNGGCCDQNGCAPVSAATSNAAFPTAKKTASQNKLANLFGLLK